MKIFRDIACLNYVNYIVQFYENVSIFTVDIRLSAVSSPMSSSVLEVLVNYYFLVVDIKN